MGNDLFANTQVKKRNYIYLDVPCPRIRFPFSKTKIIIASTEQGCCED